MSTKLRILVKKRGHKPMTGTKAIKFLCSIVQARMLRVIWPIDWDHLSMKDKLSFLAKYLPNDTKLMLIREPKWTRKNRSLYVRLIKKWKNQKRLPSDNRDDEEDLYIDDLIDPEVAPVRAQRSEELAYNRHVINTLISATSAMNYQSLPSQ